jgi:TusA-related sulfurtransferase
LPNNSLIIINASKTSKTYNVGEDVEIKFTTINSTGLLTIFINGVQYKSPLSPNPNIHDVCIEGLGEGIYTITAVLDADQNYTGDDTSVTIVVVKNNVTITVDDVTDPANIVVGSPVKFTANLNESVTGGVIFTINGANYTVHITDANVATYEYIPVNNDTITVVATFAGNDAYNASVSVEKQFDVGRIPTDINVTVKTPVTYGEDAVITVELNETITTAVKLTVGGKEYDVAIINGKGGFNVSGLNGGDYKVNVTYVGDDRYAESKKSTRFAVDRATPVITIDHAVTDANTSAVITVHINDTATGTMNITVNGKTYEAPINDGVAEFTVDVLPAGEYNITANYYALTDTNYTVNSVTLVKGLNVTKVADYPMNVSAIDVKAGENTTITGTVPEDATGIVYIDVNGTKLNKTVSGGQAVFNVTKEIAGRYVVNATLVDDKYGNKSVIGSYYVSLADAPMSIEVVEPVHANDTAVVIVTVPEDITGPVTIEINGEAYVNKSVDSNKVTFEVPGITYGNKTVVAIYGGDAKYLANSTTANFTVVKNESFIRVDATNSTVDGEVIINVTVPANAIGYVIVNVNGTNYTINVTAGEDRVAVKVVEEGLYNVTVTYIGDDNYLPSSNKTYFTVSKLNTTVTIDVNDTVYDNAVDIVVTVEDGVEGSITIKLNNTEIGTYGIVGGKVNITLYGLGAENYTIYAEYNGNYKYNENKTESKNFTVARATPVITIDNAVTDANTSAVITVHINDTLQVQ